MTSIDAAALFLSGRGDEILAPLEEEMQQASDGWNFERAAELRDRISAVRHVLERQKVVNVNGATADIVAVAQGPGGDAGVQVSFIRNGKTLGSEFFEMQASIADGAAGDPLELPDPVLRRGSDGPGDHLHPARAAGRRSAGRRSISWSSDAAARSSWSSRSGASGGRWSRWSPRARPTTSSRRGSSTSPTR